MNSGPAHIILTPHRSLPRRGFLLLMALLIAVSFAAGLGFLLLGAWPVTGLFGFDVLLVWVAFKMNYASADREERIAIDERHVQLERRSRGALIATEQFDRTWLRVELEEDRDRELIGRLLLVQSAKRVEIGSFLGPSERQELAAELRRQIALG